MWKKNHKVRQLCEEKKKKCKFKQFITEELYEKILYWKITTQVVVKKNCEFRQSVIRKKLQISSMYLRNKQSSVGITRVQRLPYSKHMYYLPIGG